MTKSPIKPSELMRKGLIDENPIFIQVISLCPALAVTAEAINGLGLGIASTLVIILSCMSISALKKWVPKSLRIPCYVVIIATFVTAIEYLLKAYLPTLDSALGIFIPLIVVNCLLMARAEAFASKQSLRLTFFDSLGMGLGLTLGLTAVGIVREFMGLGEIFGVQILPESIERMTIMILPPGAFFALAFLIAIVNFMRARNKKQELKAGEN